MSIQSPVLPSICKPKIILKFPYERIISFQVEEEFQNVYQINIWMCPACLTLAFFIVGFVLPNA